MSNSGKMTLEEKLVQTLKDETLFKLVGDEDAITELVTRAVKEALFQPRRIPRDYGGSTVTDSVVVEAAREAAKTAANEAAKEYMEKLLENEEIRKVMLETVANELPVALHGVLSQGLNDMLHRHTMNETHRLRSELISQGAGISPY